MLLAEGGDLVVIVEEQECERLPHVPLDVIGEHAEKDVGTGPDRPSNDRGGTLRSMVL